MPDIPEDPGLIPGFVVLIAPSGSYRIAAYIDAASSLGRSILIISDSQYSLVPQVAHGITVDFSDLDAATAIACNVLDKVDIACVIATDDKCMSLCSRIANQYGLPQNSADAALLAQRKDLGREALRRAGCNTPDFTVFPVNARETTINVNYPLVLKPLNLSASRGVIRANNDAELSIACKRIDAILETAGAQGFCRTHIMAESYLDGDEYAVDGFLQDGKFHLLTIFDKPEPLVGPFFEETYYLTPTRLSVTRQHALISEVERCCAAYGLEHGPIHAEIRLTTTKPVLIELAARTIGGQCGRLIEFSLGQKLEEIVINGLCGQLPPSPAQANSVMAGASAVGSSRREAVRVEK